MRNIFKVTLLLFLSFLLVSCGTTEFEVNFDVDGGTPIIESQKVKEDLKATKPEDPTKEGYSFEGWYEEGSSESFDFTTKITKDTNLVAKWSLEEEVLEITEIEMTEPTKKEYYVGQPLDLDGGFISITYNDGKESFVNLSSNMIEYDDTLVGKQDVVVKATFLEEEYTFSYEITIKEVLQVSSIGPEVKDEIVKVEGIYVGVNSTGNIGGEEVLIKDTTTNDVIGIRSFLGTLPYGLTKGDKIEVFAKVNVSEANGEVGKVHLMFSSLDNSGDINDIIVSQGHSTDFNLSEAVVINEHNDLVNFFTNGEDNYYKLLKVNDTLYGNRYGSNFDAVYYRMHMLENGNYSTMRIDGKSFALRSNYANLNTGAFVQELIFGDSPENTPGYPGAEFNGEIYFMYTGGNAYYHQVTVLDISHIQSLSFETEKTNALNELDNHFNALAKEDYTNENWLLVESYYQAGTTNINNSKSFEEIETSLLTAKNEIDSVRKDVTVVSSELIEPTEKDYYVGSGLVSTDGKIKLTYSNEEVEFFDLEVNMITGFDSSVVQNDLKLTVTFNWYEEEFIFTYNVNIIEEPVIEDAVQVSDIDTYNDGELILVEGVYVGLAGNKEVLIKDVNNSNMIGISSFLGTFPYELIKGDRIKFYANVVETNTEAEPNKKSLKFASAENSNELSDLIIAQGYSTELNLDEAYVATNQTELTEFFTNRSGNFYKLIKVSGTLYGNQYGKNKPIEEINFRMHMLSDGRWPNIKIDDRSVSGLNEIISYNLGTSFAEAVFGVTEANPGNYPGDMFTGDIYFVYAGTNPWYHQVTVLDIDHIIPETIID